MLHLQSASTDRWLAQVDENLEEILIDHAHCERKAATTALNLMNSYVDDLELSREMTRIVEEELEHYWMVIDLLQRRGIAFRTLRPGPYGRRLNALVRSGEPQRAIDRLLIAGLIEARSCERFSLLRDQMAPRDPELADFYGGLFESEARHAATYVRLAEQFVARRQRPLATASSGDAGNQRGGQPADGSERQLVRQRLEELSAAEAEIIAEGTPLARMHS